MMVFTAVAYDEPQSKTTMEKELIDETLFYKIGAGDQAAFCELYEKAGNSVFAYALSLLHSRQDAEDAMQETFLKIRSAAHLYQPMGRPMGWIITITRNICLMKFRQQNHYSQIPLEELSETFDYHKIEDREDRIVLQTAFRVLTKEECQIVVLHVISGMKHREIGELFHLPLSTVLSKYHRAMKKLRSELEEKL